MGILVDFNDGLMDRLRSVSYSETGTQSPYVTKDIDNPPNNSNTLGLQVNKRIDDTSRIAQMLVDKPGLKHLSNEALLKQSDNISKLQKGDFKREDILPQIANTAKYVAQVAGSTLAQVPVNGTGTHFLRGFRTDTYLQDGDTGGVEGAQYALRGKRVPALEVNTKSKLPDRNTTANPGDIGKDRKDVVGDITGDPDIKIGKFEVNPEKAKAKNTDGQNIQNAITGSAVPLIRNSRETTATRGSLGTTNKIDEGDITEIDPKTKNTFTEKNTYTGTFTKDNIRDIQNQNNAKKAAGIIGGKTAINADKQEVSKTSKEIATTGSYNGKPSSTLGGKQIQDFRSDSAVNDFDEGISFTYDLDYNNTKVFKEKRVGLGDQGRYKKKNKPTYYTSGSYNKEDVDNLADKINLLDVKKSPLNGVTENRDLIQLEFQILTPEQNYYLAFRAFLDTFDDNFNASWNSSKYLGRADSFYTYGGFERNINIGFKIAAASIVEMRPLYRKAATLASVTAPTYGANGRFMRGSIAKVTVGDYIYEQPGIIESVQYTWQKNYPWEISYNNPENANIPDNEKEKSQILPHVLDVSLSFKVIHDFLPQTGTNPFITNHRPTGNKDTYIPLAGQ